MFQALILLQSKEKYVPLLELMLGAWKIAIRCQNFQFFISFLNFGWLEFPELVELGGLPPWTFVVAVCPPELEEQKCANCMDPSIKQLSSILFRRNYETTIKWICIYENVGDCNSSNNKSKNDQLEIQKIVIDVRA